MTRKKNTDHNAIVKQSQPSLPSTEHAQPYAPALTIAPVPALGTILAQPRRMGWLVLVAFCLILFGWGGTAPLAGGAMAPGTITPDLGRQEIQHYEGGILQTIMVREGQNVEADQPLLALTNVKSRAGFDELALQALSLQARMIRLEAERDNHDQLDFSTVKQDPALMPVTREHDLAKIREAQSRIFSTRQQMVAFKRQITIERLSQLGKSIEGLNARLESARSQLRVTRRSLKNRRKMLRKRLTTLDSVLNIENREADLQGQIGQFISDISKTREKMAETKVDLSVMETERLSKISLEIEEVRGDLAAVTQRLKTSADVLRRTVIKAPVSGTIVGLKPTTRGSVVRKGETLMMIVPSNDKLLINARISPKDIDIVHKGLNAKVYFSSYSMREAPSIQAIVRSISADSLVSEQGRDPYYLARVEVDHEDLSRRAPNVKLMPGMPAHVLIVTRERTMLEYLLEPVITTMRRSMREA